MEKFFNYFKYISLVAGITLLICFVLSFLYGLRGDVYLKIDDKNRSLVSDMCETEAGSSLGHTDSYYRCRLCLAHYR